MNNFETAVQILRNSFTDDLKFSDAESIDDLFKAYQYDSDDIKEEFLFTLNQDPLFPKTAFDDDCNIYDGDQVYSFRKLLKEVRK